MFYEKEIYPSLPIIINFRKNNRSLRRNSDINMYKKIFQNYKNNLKYKFIIICNKEEIIEEFRDFKNVYFSKDYFNTIEYDLGLIKSSFLSFFPDSGMSVFGYFSNTPFIQFGHMNHQKEKSYIPLNKKTYNFLLDYQKVFSEDEKYDLWISEFEKMTLYLNEKGINNNQQNKPTQKNYESYF